VQELLMPASPTRRYWIALIAVAVLLRAIVALGLLHSLPITSDASAYSRQAADIVHGKASYPYYWPPGTSYLLAIGYWLFGVHVWVARTLMILVSALSVVTTTMLARLLLRRWQAAALAGWALALYPAMWMVAAEPYAQDLTLLTLTAAILFAVRAWDYGRPLDYVLLGLSLGIASLARPSTLSVAVALGVIAVFATHPRRHRRAEFGGGRVLAGALLSAVVMVATLTPALIHNRDHHQGYTVAINSEVNLWYGNNPYTPNYKTWDLGQRSASSFGPVAQRYLDRFTHPGPITRAERSAYLQEALRFVYHHPAVTVLRTTNRVRAFWGFDYTMSSEFRNDWHKSAAVEALGLVFEAGGYAVLVLLVIIGLGFARDLLRPGALTLLIVVIAAFELPYALDYAAGRWHYPILGLLAVVAGAGAYWLVITPDRWRRLRRSWAFWAALAVVLVVQLEYAYFATRGPTGSSNPNGVSGPQSSAQRSSSAHFVPRAQTIPEPRTGRRRNLPA
jgi:4-amino-4-deoxy-L-arabinose transferase-like glycosyltransferase